MPLKVERLNDDASVFAVEENEAISDFAGAHDRVFGFWDQRFPVCPLRLFDIDGNDLVARGS